MDFNSLEFIILLVVFLFIWSKLSKSFNRYLILIIFSLIFYGWNEQWILGILLFSSIVDYFSGHLISQGRNRSLALFVSVLTNLSILGFFKYFYPGKFPMGVSFYTFQSMSYTLDIYKNRGVRAKNFLHFFSYISMFPQLVAGPICRSRELLNKITHSQDKIDYVGGYCLILQGYFKKTFLADHLAVLINPMIGPKIYFLDFSQSWILMIGYSWQIYFDFSGYTDIARGIGKCMGIELPENFLKPYSAVSLREFWRKWHITLSQWFRDYVYIPLGGSRQASSKVYLSILVTMGLSGIWHGGSFNFVIWGFFHGILLILEKIIGVDFKSSESFLIDSLNRIRTYLIVVFGWAFFRVQDLDLLTKLCENLILFDHKSTFPLSLKYVIMLSSLSLLLEWKVFDKRHKSIVTICLFLILIVFFRSSPQEFIYYRF